jgi:hypothetical protein
VKDTIGLAHLYSSFSQNGIMMLLHIALLVALLLFVGETRSFGDKDTFTVMTKAFHLARPNGKTTKPLNAGTHRAYFSHSC